MIKSLVSELRNKSYVNEIKHRTRKMVRGKVVYLKITDKVHSEFGTLIKTNKLISKYYKKFSQINDEPYLTSTFAIEIPKSFGDMTEHAKWYEVMDKGYDISMIDGLLTVLDGENIIGTFERKTTLTSLFGLLNIKVR